MRIFYKWTPIFLIKRVSYPDLLIILNFETILIQNPNPTVIVKICTRRLCRPCAKAIASPHRRIAWSIKIPHWARWGTTDIRVCIWNDIVWFTQNWCSCWSGSSLGIYQTFVNLTTEFKKRVLWYRYEVKLRTQDQEFWDLWILKKMPSTLFPIPSMTIV